MCPKLLAASRCWISAGEAPRARTGRRSGRAATARMRRRTCTTPLRPGALERRRRQDVARLALGNRDQAGLGEELPSLCSPRGVGPAHLLLGRGGLRWSVPGRRSNRRCPRPSATGRASRRRGGRTRPGRGRAASERRRGAPRARAGAACSAPRRAATIRSRCDSCRRDAMPTRPARERPPPRPRRAGPDPDPCPPLREAPRGRTAPSAAASRPRSRISGWRASGRGSRGPAPARGGPGRAVPRQRPRVRIRAVAGAGTTRTTRSHRPTVGDGIAAPGHPFGMIERPAIIATTRSRSIRSSARARRPSARRIAGSFRRAPACLRSNASAERSSRRSSNSVRPARSRSRAIPRTPGAETRLPADPGRPSKSSLLTAVHPAMIEPRSVRANDGRGPRTEETSDGAARAGWRPDGQLLSEASFRRADRKDGVLVIPVATFAGPSAAAKGRRARRFHALSGAAAAVPGPRHAGRGPNVMKKRRDELDPAVDANGSHPAPAA